MPAVALTRPIRVRGPPESPAPKKLQNRATAELTTYNHEENAMETKKVLIVCALAVLLVGFGITSDVLAGEAESEASSSGRVAPEGASAEVFVVGGLGAAATATDVWHVLCGAGTNHLAVDVADNGGFDGVRIGVCGHDSGGNPARCTIAPDGGVSVFIDPASSDLPGAYYVTFFKSVSGTAENYDSFIQCHNAAHGSVSTTVVLVQNQ